jgi:hypothetical protein
MDENTKVTRLPYMGPHPEHASWERENERRRWIGRAISQSCATSVSRRMARGTLTGKVR